MTRRRAVSAQGHRFVVCDRLHVFMEVGLVACDTRSMYIYRQGVICMVGAVMHCGEFSSMWLVVVMRVYRALVLLDGIHRCGMCASGAVDAGLVYETLLIAGNGEETFGKKMKFYRI